MPTDGHKPVVGRRSVLQSISAMAVALVHSRPVIASGRAGEVARETIRQLRIDRQFILFPVNNDASPRYVRLAKDGKVLRFFSASLGLPAQWWAHLDVSEWHGEELNLSVEPDERRRPPGMEIPGRGGDETSDAELIAAIRTSADIWSPETIYKEPQRPLFHFSARRGWTNDPIGLVYHNGRYHLFFIYNPYELRSGNPHWGHAVSTDLIHWEELPIALYPRGEKDFPISGSAVVDIDNSAKWARNGRAPLVVAFTSTGRGECIVYSQDDGATWQEFEGNPVVEHKGRDPRLIWHAETKQWVMAVYSLRRGAGPTAPERHGIAFYTSPDLKSWRERSWIDGYFECPDLFALPVDGDPIRRKWVLTGAPGYYAIGEFDGACFTPDTPHLPGPAGGAPIAKRAVGNLLPATTLHAFQTFSDHPAGQVVQIAWGLVDTVDAPFTQLMSFPTELSLRTTSDGIRLCREPVDAIRSLHVHSHDIPAGPLTDSLWLDDLEGEAWDIEAIIKIGAINNQVVMSIGGDEYAYQCASQMLHGPRGSLYIPLPDGRLQLRILVDRTTVEIFGDRGQAYGLFIRSKPGGNAKLALRASHAILETTLIEKLKIYSLRSAWKTVNPA